MAAMSNPDLDRSELDPVELTRACALSEHSLVLVCVKTSSDIYDPASVVWKCDASTGVPCWEARRVDCDVAQLVPSDTQADCVLLSSEGVVIVDVFGAHTQERLIGAGTWIDVAKGYGRMLSLAKIGEALHACGNGGQIYVRNPAGQWSLLTDAVLFDAEADARLNRKAPLTTDPDFLQWLMDSRMQRPRNLSLHAIAGLHEDAVYACGVAGTTPVLCFWDGQTLHELDLPIDAAALTGIHVEHEDSVWVCGRDGVLLHGSHARGFALVDPGRQHGLFHMMTAYRGKLVLPASTDPSGLFELDLGALDLRHFMPALPALRGDHIFYAAAVGKVLWVVGQQDIFRFDGSTWSRIEHPRM